MTSVVSGGLVYEYIEEGSGYGLVNIHGNTVVPIGSQFSDLQQEFAQTTDPTGDGGYSPNNPPQECPGQSKDWDTKPFTGSDLPACPSGALKYFKSGAGTGPGLNGPGSQTAPGGSSTTAAAGAGAVTHTYASGSTASGNAAASLHMAHPTELLPLAMCGVAVVLSFAFGVSIF